MDDRADLQQRLSDILFPYAQQKLRAIRERNGSFVYYTSAETASQIIRNGEFWMRRATTMNDFMEVQHGMDCLTHAWGAEPGIRLKALLENLFPGVHARITERFDSVWRIIKFDTYLICVSEHDDDEDQQGRLSMWRAYGKSSGVALILNHAPFSSEADGTALYSSPVAYLDADKFTAHFMRIVEGLEREQGVLAASGADNVLGNLVNMMRFAVLCTKHPGFAEEKEWRVMHSPAFEQSKAFQPVVEVVHGIPQHVCKVPLRTSPEFPLAGVAIPELVNRIIIGPTQFPDAVFNALADLMAKAGVANPGERMSVSRIPLRPG
jgi:hypothetical protein